MNPVENAYMIFKRLLQLTYPAFFLSLPASVWALPSETNLALLNDHMQRCWEWVEAPEIAIGHCTAALQSLDPSDFIAVMILNNRGLAYLEKSDYDHAIEDQTRVLQSQPLLSTALMGRGAAYAGKQDYNRAIQDFNLALQTNPDDTVVLFMRGTAYHYMGEYDSAVQDFDKVIRLQPEFAEPYSERGYVYTKKGNHDRAIQDYDEAIRLEPGKAQDLIRRGNGYSRRGQYDRALKDYEEVLRIDPNDARAFRGRGRALFYLDRLEESQLALSKAVTLEPKDAYGTVWLYLVRRKAGQDPTKEFEANAGRLDLTAWPGPIVKLFSGAVTEEALLQSAKHSDSKKDREQRCEAYFYLGEHALLRGNKGAAAKWFKAALETRVFHYIEYQAADYELKRLAQ